MAFDPVTLLTISVVVLVALGVLMLHAARGEEPCPALWLAGAAFLCLGAGFLMLLAAPDDVRAPVRVIGNAALMAAYGLLWRAARTCAGRPAPFEAAAAGTLVWLLAAAFLDPSQAWRIALTSAIVAVYSALAAFEHHRGPPVPSGRWAVRAFAGHAGFFALRSLFGPTFGLAPWGASIAGAWGALLGLETVLAAVVIGSASMAMSRERAAARHREDALQDPLTGVGNRRALHRSGEPLLEAAVRAGRPAALLLMDLDGFKAVNDNHGHPAGDGLLVAFARLAHEYLPPTSLVCRLGGEEFAALLPGADAARARAVADEIRELFAHLRIDGPCGPVRTTVSVGVALAADPGDDLAAMLGRADACLYAAKRGGRDRVAVEGDAGAPAPPARRSEGASAPPGTSLARPAGAL